MKNKGLQSRKFRGGAYAALLSAIVLLLLLGINLVASELLPDRDLTKRGTYSLTEEAKQYLENVKTPVTMYYISEQGEETLAIARTAELFAKENKWINLVYKDPVQYPQFAYQYTGTTTVNNNSIVVVNEENPEKYCFIDAEAMRVYSLDSTSYQKILTGYDTELELVKALVQITSGAQNQIYLTTGHGEYLIQAVDANTGEKRVSDTLDDLFTLNNYGIRYLDLNREGKIPADCSALVIGGATTDLTEEETEVLRDYLTNGGTLILLLYYTEKPLANLQALMQDYGMQMETGLLHEGDSNYTEQGKNSYILTKYEDKNVEWALGTGVTILPSLRKSLTVTSLEQTTEQAYLKTDLKNQEWAEGDAKGQYSLLTQATETFEGKTANFYVFATCFYLADRCIDGNASYNNRVQFLSVLQEITGEGNVISISNTSIMEEALTITTRQKTILAVISLGVLPGIFLLAGLIVVIRRRQ